uniref:Protein FAR1-RELATED SEQUENCE 7 n=1 Tax=Cajanus cajan TaxID=3821 RepID=A0A151U002_CAJCA|nr:Protein FAR1-RELATED SEQUENCE 7 [Cajanus cajan]
MIKDGDVSVALSYLEGKAGNDPMFLFKISYRSYFQCFGDVLAFDTTYKKNKYNIPLVIFSGCNHHSQTTIFGCALLADETTETYTWVLETFLDAIHNKYPRSVVTDGDGVMREAIKQVFPDASHHLSAWHLHKNACENVKLTQ